MLEAFDAILPNPFNTETRDIPVIIETKSEEIMIWEDDGGPARD